MGSGGSRGKDAEGLPLTAHFAQAGVTARDIQSLAERINGDALLSQRKGFDPAGFQTLPAKRKRPSPFRRS